MKKLLLLLLICLTVSTFAQVSPRNAFVVNNSSTAFGINLTVGSFVFDDNSDSLWVLYSPAASTATLNSTTTKYRVYPQTAYAPIADSSLWEYQADTLQPKVIKESTEISHPVVQSIEKRGDGDANNNGYITATDALYVKQYLGGTYNPSYRELSQMDFDGDGYISWLDAYGIEAKSIGNDYRIDLHRATQGIFTFGDANMDQDCATFNAQPQLNRFDTIGGQEYSMYDATADYFFTPVPDTNGEGIFIGIGKVNFDTLSYYAKSEDTSVWSRDVTNHEIYPKTLTDSVGVGTNNPNYPLHVKGPTGSTTAIGYFEQGSTSGDQANVLYATQSVKSKDYGNLAAIYGITTYATTGTNPNALTGIFGIARASGAGNMNTLYGIKAVSDQISSSSTVTNAIGCYAYPINSGGGTITNGYSFYTKPYSTASGGSMATWVGLYMDTPSMASVTTTSSRGISIPDYTFATNNTIIGVGTLTTGNFGLYINSTKDNYFAGNIGIKDATPSYELDITGSANLTGNLTFDGAGSTIDAWTTTITSDDDTDVPTEGAVYDYVNDAIAQHIFDPDASIITNGTQFAGTVDSCDLHDGKKWTIREATGSPGTNVQAIFDSVDYIPNRITFHGNYDGSITHGVSIQMWDYIDAAWETYSTLQARSTMEWVEITIPDPADHVRNDSCKIRLYHSASGNTSHYLYIDYLVLSTMGFGSSSDHGELAGLADDDHTQYALLAGRSGDVLHMDTIVPTVDWKVNIPNILDITPYDPGSGFSSILYFGGDHMIGHYGGKDTLEIITTKGIYFDVNGLKKMVFNGNFYPQQNLEIGLGYSTSKWKSFMSDNIADSTDGLRLKVPYKDYDSALVIHNDTVGRTALSLLWDPATSLMELNPGTGDYIHTFANGEDDDYPGLVPGNVSNYDDTYYLSAVGTWKALPGGSSKWTQLTNDTIATYNHVKIDSSFRMQYEPYYLGVDTALEAGVYAQLMSVTQGNDIASVRTYHNGSNETAFSLNAANGERNYGIGLNSPNGSGGDMTLYAQDLTTDSVSRIEMKLSKIRILSKDSVIFKTGELLIDAGIKVLDLDSASTSYGLYYNKSTGVITFDSAASGGTSPGGWVGTATSNLDMSDYNIIDADTVEVEEHLKINNTYELDPTPNTDHTASGRIVYMTAGETLAFGDLLTMSTDGELYKADATSTAKMTVVYLALGSGTNGNPVKVLEDGYVRDDSWSWTIGEAVYAAAGSTAFTQTAPTGTDDVVQILGIATAATIIKFRPEQTYIELN